MNTSFLTLMLVLFCGVSILLIRNVAVRKKSINWLYLLSGGLALYLVETTTYQESLLNTLLLVLALYLIPMIIDGIVHSVKKLDDDHSIV
ncbi:hypothetical protein [Methylomonas sp. AM2-LC]|uniref:hypothetical protein n=1 Tax=Methylomonas sp. AM2-LC TaxID=3153301 RepID=UPI0032668429